MAVAMVVVMTFTMLHGRVSLEIPAEMLGRAEDQPAHTVTLRRCQGCTRRTGHRYGTVSGNDAGLHQSWSRDRDGGS